MSYIAHLKALSEQERTDEIKRKILESQGELLNDHSRTKLLNGGDLNCWDDIDELTIEQVRFDDTTGECVAEFYWQSFGPKDEGDERSMYGNATATFSDDESVSYSDATANFEGDAPRPELEEADDEDAPQERQDEQDKAENITKDW